MLFGLNSTPAFGAQDDPRLDTLFIVLQATSDPDQARLTAKLIETIWITSADEDINRDMRLGQKALLEKRFPAALARFTRVTRKDPFFAEGWNRRAIALSLMGRTDEALADLCQALFLEPRHFEALSGLGLVYMVRDREEDALEAFEKALKYNPHLSFPRRTARELRVLIQKKHI